MASRTWQPADALTLSGPATIVSQQQLRLQHRTAAAYTTNYSALSHSFRDPGQSFRVPPAATSSSSPAAASQQRSSSNSSASSHTSNNNTINSHHPPHSRAVASRFSPPLQNSHSQALPGRHLAAGGGAAHQLQAVQQHQQQQTYHPHPHSLVPHSRPSLPLSPIPRRTRRAHNTPSPSVSRWCTTTAPRPGTAPAAYLSGGLDSNLDWHPSKSFQ